MTYMEQETRTGVQLSKRTQVKVADRPGDCRYISTTTQRLLGTTLYVVAEVDGTNRCTDPQRLFTTTDPAKAMMKHQVMVSRAGGQAKPPPPPDPVAPDTTGKGKPRKPRPRSTPKQREDGSWLGRVVRNGKKYTQVCDTRRQAEEFIDRMIREHG